MLSAFDAGIIQSMVKSTLRWILQLAALLAVGPLAYAVTHKLLDASQGPAATLLVGQSMGAGLTAGAIVFALALGMGLLGSRFFSLASGLTAAGFVLAWGAWGLGSLEAIVHRTRDASDLPLLAFEAMLAMSLTVAVVTLCGRVAPKSTDSDGHKPLDLKGFGVASLIAAIVGAVAVWIFSATMLKGQTIAAAAIAGILASACTQLFAKSKEAAAGPLPTVFGLGLVAVVGPFAARLMHGSELVNAIYAGTFLPLARPISLDWAAGALIGIPIGLSWAGSMLERKPATA